MEKTLSGVLEQYSQQYKNSYADKFELFPHDQVQKIVEEEQVKERKDFWKSGAAVVVAIAILGTFFCPWSPKFVNMGGIYNTVRVWSTEVGTHEEETRGIKSGFDLLISPEIVQGLTQGEMWHRNSNANQHDKQKFEYYKEGFGVFFDKLKTPTGRQELKNILEKDKAYFGQSYDQYLSAVQAYEDYDARNPGLAGEDLRDYLDKQGGYEQKDLDALQSLFPGVFSK